MLRAERSLLVVALATGLLGAAAAAAQESSNTIGPPQLRDFSLTPKQRIVTQPDPNTRPAQVAPPPPATRPTTTTSPASRPPAATPTPTQRTGETTRAQPSRPTVETAPPSAQPVTTQPAPAQPAPSLTTPLPVEIAPPQAEPAAPPAAAAPSSGTNWWFYAIPLVLIGLAGAVYLRRRRRPEEEVPVVETAPVVAAPPAAPRPDPVPRPWLELELKTDRASFTESEAVIQFELSISNAGGSLARNLRIDVKMFNAGREQDQEIGAFFKTAGRQSTKLNLPGIAPDSTGIIRGEVAMPLEEMRAVKLDGRMLFIPVVAVNALYDWGENRTGHTAKSYVVGRELEQSSEKMGAFRVDQGPRIWRTVGQRPHTLAKRV